jgi:tRNA U34 5-methylaminomethyl-2-thiouridine-forming methyltransferase MnmC
MRSEIKITGDGSATLYVPELKEHYHSIYGAVQESMHVFIQEGLNSLKINDLAILEIGFGTGLNALLTLVHSRNFNSVDYHAIEKYPLEWELVRQLRYGEYLNLPVKMEEEFREMHLTDWDSKLHLGENFMFRKMKINILEYQPSSKFSLIYFDAFSPSVQPELWEEAVFTRLFNSLHPNGILVTYCAKGKIRRMLNGIGFRVERLAGPPGKREMIRARHPDH